MNYQPPTKAAQTLYAGDRLFYSDYELEFAYGIGDTRCKLDVARRCQPHVIQELDRIRANSRGGALAELVVARRFGIYPKLDFDQYVYYDLKLPGGDLVAVQRNVGGACILDKAREAIRIERKKEPPDLYISVAMMLD